MEKYGMELIIDLHGCDTVKMQKENIDVFFAELCSLSDMTPVGTPKYWIENSNNPKLKGLSGIQFIKTSSILIHTLDLTRSAYINFFSCKDFNVSDVLAYIEEFFNCSSIEHTLINRI